MESFYKKYQSIFLFLLILSSIIFLISFYLTPITTNDFWIQLKVGELIKETSQIPNTVLFAYTKAQNYPFVAHEWLPSLLFSFFYDFFGYNFMIVLKCLLSFVIYILAFFLANRILKNITFSIFVSSLCMFTMNYRSFLRPEIFSYIFFLCQLNLLNLYVKTRYYKYLIFVIFVHILWVNSHGSFLISIGLPALCAAGLFLDRLIFFVQRKNNVLEIKDISFLFLTFLACVFSSLLNPFGFNLIEHTYALSQNETIKQMVFEWNPTFTSSVMATRIFDFYIIFISILGLIFIFNFRKLKSFHWFLLIVFAYLSVAAQRHIAFFAIASVLPISIMLKDVVRFKKLNILFTMGLTSVLLGLSLWSFTYGNAVSTVPGFYKSARISDKTIDYIRDNNLSGNVINTYSLGAQILFHFFPKIKIAIDSRIDAYGLPYISYYRNILFGEYRKLKTFISRYEIKHMIIDYSSLNGLVGNGSYNELRRDGWKISHESTSVIILSKF